MNSDEQNELANEAGKALENEFVIEVINELLGNLRVEHGGLEEYGIRKVARYAAIVARCQALGIDPAAMRSAPEDTDRFQARLAQAFLDAGKDVIVIVR